MAKVKFKSYIPKMAYHLSEGNVKSFKHFQKRHNEVYGRLSHADLETLMDCVEICHDVEDREERDRRFVELGIPTSCQK